MCNCFNTISTNIQMKMKLIFDMLLLIWLYRILYQNKSYLNELRSIKNIRQLTNKRSWLYRFVKKQFCVTSFILISWKTTDSGWYYVFWPVLNFQAHESAFAKRERSLNYKIVALLKNITYNILSTKYIIISFSKIASW